MKEIVMSSKNNELGSFYLRLMKHPELIGKSNKQVARELGVGPSTVGQWRRLGIWPEMDTLVRVSDLLGVEVAWFLQNEERPLVKDLDVDTGLGELAVQRLEKISGDWVRFVVAGNGDSLVIDLSQIVLLVQSHLSRDDLWYFLFGEEYRGRERGMSSLQDG